MSGKLMSALYNMAAKRPACHWISPPDGDQGREWCPDCGHFKARNMRHRDRKQRRDYILDGGWPTGHDIMPICAGCGAYLEGSLTEYGARQEMDFYKENGLSSSPDVDAIYLYEIISALEYSTGDRRDFDLATKLAEDLVAKAPAGRSALKDNGADNE